MFRLILVRVRPRTPPCKPQLSVAVAHRTWDAATGRLEPRRNREPQGSQQTFVQGQHFSGTGYELDGTDNQDPILGIIIINPNLDSVQEAKITLMNYDAEFGKSIAGMMVASTKSGTNEIHGSAFWFRNSDYTQARNPFNQGPDSPLPSSKWNQFGGSVGGAIIKNKLFYFADYQGTRQSNGITNNIVIPTSTVLSTCTAATGFCDLSQYLGAVSNSNGQIYDPATGTAILGRDALHLRTI